MRFFIAINWVFDLFHFGTGPIARYSFIVFTSILSAIIILLLYKKTSNQKKIKFHKDQIFGNLLQMSLYKDKLILLFASILAIVRHNIFYIMHSFIPFLIICLPIIALTVQVNNRCGYDPLRINQPFIIHADLITSPGMKNLPAILEQIYCITSPDIIIETPPLRLEKEGEAFWRAKVDDIPLNGSPYIRLGVQGNNHFIEKTIVTDYHHKRFSPVKAKWSLSTGLFNNAEGFLSDDALFDMVSIDYKRASYEFFLWRLDAIVLYFIFTLIFVFVLKGVLKVRI